MAKYFYVKGDNAAELGATAPTGLEHLKYGDLVFLVEADVQGLRRRHVDPDELSASGAPVSQHPQAWVDSIPNKDGKAFTATDLFPWIKK